MDNMTAFSVLLVAFPEAVLVAALGLLLVGIRPRWHQLVFFGIVQAGIAYLVRLMPVPFGLHSLLLAVGTIILIRLIMRLDWRLSSLAALFGLTVYVAIETAVSPLSLLVSGYSLVSVMESPTLRFLFFLPEALLLVLLIWLCLRFNFRLVGPPPGYGIDDNDWRTLSRSYFLVYLLAALPVFLLGTLNLAFFTSRSGVFPDQYLPVFLALIALAVLLLTALTPIKIQAVSRAAADACTARKTAENLVHIGELLQLIRRQHHDFHHQLQTVYGLLETGYYEEARQHIRKTYETISTPLELIRTDQPHVTALLYTKLVLAEARQIRLEPVIECSLQNLPLSPLETSALLSNLLDNALEAVENAPPEERVIRLEIRRDSGGYIIVVANRGRVETSLPNRFFQAGYTTKEGHTGLGLVSARETVVRHGGTITLSCDGVETVFQIRLPMDNSLVAQQTTEKQLGNRKPEEEGNVCQSPY